MPLKAIASGPITCDSPGPAIGEVNRDKGNVDVCLTALLSVALEDSAVDDS